MTLEAEIGAGRNGFRIDLTLRLTRGETLAVVGPNGSGKTSLLRALAGLLPLDKGRVLLDGSVLEDVRARVRVPAEQRPIGMLFQDYLLFPHLSVEENVAFGPRARGMSRIEAIRVARTWLERVGLEACARRRPPELSGGQAQRVALARAMATQPAMLLLDEPMAALDASTRVSVRRELRRDLAAFGGVRILVTHDPVEAMAMADRLLVIENGAVLQTGTPSQVAQRPRSPYVADLVGVNLFRGRAQGNIITLADGGSLTVAGADDGDVFAIVHPRSVALYRQRPEGTPRNLWPANAVDIDPLGDRVRVRLSGRPAVIAEVTPAAARELGLDRGEQVWVAVKATEIDVYAV